MVENERTSRKVYSLVDEYLLLHKGESFTLDRICRDLEISERENRKLVAIKLNYEISVKDPVVYKDSSNKETVYRYIDKTLTLLNDWVDVKEIRNVSLAWPSGADGSELGFENFIDIPEKSLVLIAGVTNTGKSVMLRNILWRNMHNYHFDYYTSETSREDFADYASRMPWANPLNGNGQPVFDLIQRYKDFHEVIDPNAVSLIDWLNLGDKFYQIGEKLGQIKAVLDQGTGVCFVAIQKNAANELGMGGMWGEHLASVYITLDFERLTVKKAKKWHDYNPNGRSWGFTIVDRGVHFHAIHEVVKCKSCWGRGRVGNAQCSMCWGTGWVDKESF